MLVTVTRRIICVLVVIIIFITSCSLLSEKVYNKNDSSVENIKTPADVEYVEKEITNQEKNLEMLRSRMENIREELTEVGSRQKRSLPSDLPKCPVKSPHLLGSLTINEEVATLTGAEDKLRGAEVARGGSHAPSDCQPGQKTAFIIPYRDRASHLAIWLAHLHPILARQQLDYQIFVVEQVDNFPFNRGALLNLGVLEAGRRGQFSCYVLHDVDMVPESDLPLYHCPPPGQVLHMAVSVSRWRYKLSYPQYLGGIVLASNQTINNINGFSNSFYGWGGEDDDFYCRLVRNNITINRYPGSVARFRMLAHAKVEENPQLREMDQLSKTRQLDNDGLKTVNYTLVNIKTEELFTRIRVKLGPPPVARQRGWFESIARTVHDTENKIVNSVVEKINQLTEEEEEPKRLKIYY